MTRSALAILLVCLTGLLAGCSLAGGEEQTRPDLSADLIESYTAEQFSRGFGFCPDSYLEVEVVQIHENPQFSFYNRVDASGVLELQIAPADQTGWLKARAEIPLVGEGWAGVCSFTTTGTLTLDLQARLYPGEDGQRALLVVGDCQTYATSQPPCGDFGIIPLEKKVQFTIPYQDGGTFQQKWSSRAAGITGVSSWTLHIPCQR